MQWGVFLFFAAWVAVMVAFVWLLLPETRGRALENTFREFQAHWFWSRHSDVGEVHVEPFAPLAPLKVRGSSQSFQGPRSSSSRVNGLETSGPQRSSRDHMC